VEGGFLIGNSGAICRWKTKNKTTASKGKKKKKIGEKETDYTHLTQGKRRQGTRTFIRKCQSADKRGKRKEIRCGAAWNKLQKKKTSILGEGISSQLSQFSAVKKNFFRKGKKM